MYKSDSAIGRLQLYITNKGSVTLFRSWFQVAVCGIVMKKNCFFVRNSSEWTEIPAGSSAESLASLSLILFDAMVDRGALVVLELPDIVRAGG
jgi:hypothetical protein